MVVKLSPKIRWFIFKRKLVRFVGLAWCDWCETICFFPTHLENAGEDVCRHCVDDASNCECCNELVHPDLSKDMPEGWYHQDCYDDIYG